MTMAQTLQSAFLALLILSGCSTSKTELQTSRWQPSTLSKETISAIHASSQDYFSCIDRQLSEYRYFGGDSRYETGRLLKQCENRLEPAQSSLNREHVYEKIVQRYLRRKRTQAARYVLRMIMAMEAQQKAAQVRK